MNDRLIRSLTVVIFVILFILGMSNISGYGLPIDEPTEQRILLMNIKEYSEIAGISLRNPVFNGIKRISESIEQDHGIAAYYLFTPILMFTGLDSLTCMYVWHVYTYLLWFLGVIALYAILKEIARNRWTPLIGILLYFFTPRMYAEGHYNNKDIVLLSLVLIMLAFAVRIVKRWKDRDIIGFAIASGFLMNCKIIGIAIWGLTGLFAIGYVFREFGKTQQGKRFSDLGLSAILSLIIFFVLTPAMWRLPVGYIQYCISNATRFSRWDGSFLFHGNTVTPMSMGIPRTYLLQWILITTPVYIIVLFLSSIVIFAIDVYKKMGQKGESRNVTGDRRGFYTLFILTFLFPVVTAVIKAPTLVLYNGWRHNYYLYAYVLLCSCYSVDRILDGGLVWDCRYKTARLIMSGLVVIGFSVTLFDMISHRSYEYMYFNPITRKLVDVEGFEGDYWNVAELPVLEEFARQYNDVVTVAHKGYASTGQFKNIQVGNLKIVSESDESDFYIYNTWMMRDKSELADYDKVYSFEKYGHEMYAIFQKK